jgi:aspartate/methionine/tyrosine aminotransferase
MPHPDAPRSTLPHPDAPRGTPWHPAAPRRTPTHPDLIAPRIRALDLPPFDPLNVRAAELRAEGHAVISLGQALPFFAPPASAIEAARAAVDRPDVHVYATDPGLPSLRAALASRLSPEFGQPITPDDLLIAAGANHAFTLALTTMVSPGDEVLLPAPYFTNHYMTIVALGAVPVEAPVADRETFDVRWADLAPHVTPRTRAIVLCSPSNPTGAPVSRAEGEVIVREAAARGIAVISDETYMALVYDRPHWSAASAPGWRENVVVVGSFSKAFGMMGWRVGFVLADAAVCDQIVKVQDTMIICAPVISQVAAEAAVRFDWDHARAHHDELRARRAVLAQALAAIPRVHWTPTAGGLFAFARVDGCDESDALARDLLERAHVVTIPGSAFGPSGEGCLRLSYGRADRAQLAEAGRRMREYFGG